jgi:hypothetical protein
MCLSTFSGRDPMAVSPRRIVSDVLLMSALKLSNPVQIFIQMKTNNFPQLTLKLSWRFHKILPDWNKPFPSWSKAEVLNQNFCRRA